jgi:hypothetical protein
LPPATSSTILLVRGGDGGGEGEEEEGKGGNLAWCMQRVRGREIQIGKILCSVGLEVIKLGGRLMYALVAVYAYAGT